MCRALCAAVRDRHVGGEALVACYASCFRRDANVGVGSLTGARDFAVERGLLGLLRSD